jgi:uncharacterized protein (TIGR02147 family)
MWKRITPFVMTQLDIKQFTDYRAFLLAHVQDSKRRNIDWTYGVFAKTLGLKDTSSITKIVQGQRTPGPAITSELIRYFQFSPKEAAYFQDLVRLQKIKSDPRLTVLLLEKMGKDHPDGALRLLDDKSFRLVSNWYCTTIREMVRLDEFFEDPNWISKKLHFKVTPTEAARAIELLIQVDLLKRDDKGKLAIAQGRFHTTNDISNEAIKRYHEAMLDNAKLALRKFDVEDREITATCLTMSSSRFSEAKELIREFRHRFAKLMEEDHGDITVQMQIQFFPLTKVQSSVRADVRQTKSNQNPEEKEI